MNLKNYMGKNDISKWVIETVFKVKFELLSEGDQQKILGELIALEKVDHIEAEINYLRLEDSQA